MSDIKVAKFTHPSLSSLSLPASPKSPVKTGPSSPLSTSASMFSPSERTRRVFSLTNDGFLGGLQPTSQSSDRVSPPSTKMIIAKDDPEMRKLPLGHCPDGPSNFYQSPKRQLSPTTQSPPSPSRSFSHCAAPLSPQRGPSGNLQRPWSRSSGPENPCFQHHSPTRQSSFQRAMRPATAAASSGTQTPMLSEPRDLQDWEALRQSPIRCVPRVDSSPAPPTLASSPPQSPQLATSLAVSKPIPTLRESTDADGSHTVSCSICWEQRINCVFVPCGHMSCCFACASPLKECPICRNLIERCIRTYSA